MEKLIQENHVNHIKQVIMEKGPALLQNHKFNVIYKTPQCLQSQRLDGEDKDNQRTQYLLVITTQEVLKRFLENNFENKFSALE